MNETKFADSSEEESFGRFAQYIDYPKEMPFPNMRFECGGPDESGDNYLDLFREIAGVGSC